MSKQFTVTLMNLFVPIYYKVAEPPSTRTHRHLASTPPTPTLVSLAAHLHSQLSVLGYQFLTYLADTKPHRLSPYKELATRINKNNFVAVLVKDMKV